MPSILRYFDTLHVSPFFFLHFFLYFLLLIAQYKNTWNGGEVLVELLLQLSPKHLSFFFFFSFFQSFLTCCLSRRHGKSGHLSDIRSWICGHWTSGPVHQRWVGHSEQCHVLQKVGNLSLCVYCLLKAFQFTAGRSCLKQQFESFVHTVVNCLAKLLGVWQEKYGE